MAAQPTPVDDLLNLVDACNRCSLAFRETDKQLSNLVFRQFYDKLQKTLNRFIFELEKESSRISSDQHPIPRTPLGSKSLRSSSTSLWMQAEDELQSTLEGYDRCLGRPMPAHARAMIQRQRQSLSRLRADLDEMSETGSVSIS